MPLRRTAVLALAFAAVVGPARSATACELVPLSCPMDPAEDVAASVGGEAGDVVGETGDVVTESVDAVTKSVEGLTADPIPEPPPIGPPGPEPGGTDPGPRPGGPRVDRAPPQNERGARVVVAGVDRSPSRPPNVASSAAPSSPPAWGPVPIALPGPRPPAGIGRVVLDALPSAAAAVALFALALVFAAVQARIDRRDARLALAPAFEDEVVFE